jgi:plasmid replication initiation protein
MGIEKKGTVTISHELTRAAYSLTLNEKRVLLKGASVLDSYGSADQMIELNAGECAEFYGMDKKSAYGQLAKAVERLWDRTLVLKDGTRLRWVISCKYEEGSILLKFHPDLNPHLLDLQSRFTRYLLTRAASFKLMYTWRLFELLMQFKKTGMLSISLDDFKESLEIPEYYSNDFSRIRVKVIEPAVKEIRQKDGLKVTWKPLKKGRSVVALEFKFPVEPQHELFTGGQKNNERKTDSGPKPEKITTVEPTQVYDLINELTRRGGAKKTD